MGRQSVFRRREGRSVYGDVHGEQNSTLPPLVSAPAKAEACELAWEVAFPFAQVGQTCELLSEEANDKVPGQSNCAMVPPPLSV